MKRIALLCASLLLLLACSVSDILTAVVPAPPTVVAPTSAVSATDVPPAIEPNSLTPSSTATAHLETATSPITATQISGTETVPAVETAMPIFDTVVPTSSFPSATPDVPGEGFQSVSISGSQIFWGVCEPGTAVITATVEDPSQVYSVLFFFQLQETTSDDSTPWSNGDDMEDEDGGLFTYTLDADNVSGRRNYLEAWVQFQLVATDGTGQVVGRTKVYMDKLTIRPCP